MHIASHGMINTHQRASTQRLSQEALVFLFCWISQLRAGDMFCLYAKLTALLTIFIRLRA